MVCGGKIQNRNLRGGAGRVGVGLAVALILMSLRGGVQAQDCGALTPYKSNYAMLAYDTLNSPPRHARELIFHLSFEIETCFLPHVYLAYSQASFWQIFDTSRSSPFRETNYNPEIFYRREWGQWPWMNGRVAAQIGYEHESNGQGPALNESGQPVNLSRSWDRTYLWLWWHSETEHPVVAAFKWWYRKPEQVKVDPLQVQGDDNPTIQDRLGKGELYLGAPLSRRAGLLAMLRKGRKDKTGTLSLDYVVETQVPGVFLLLRFFQGYGESLIDYDRRVERYGLGLSFSDPMAQFR